MDEFFLIHPRTNTTLAACATIPEALERAAQEFRSGWDQIGFAVDTYQLDYRPEHELRVGVDPADPSAVVNAWRLRWRQIADDGEEVFFTEIELIAPQAFLGDPAEMDALVAGAARLPEAQNI